MIETYTATVAGESVTCLRNPEAYPVRRVAGDIMTADGYLDRRSHMYVRVTPDGRAWSVAIDRMGPEDVLLSCERWADMERIGVTFSPDAGEFDRCGIVPTLCGSLAEN